MSTGGSIPRTLAQVVADALAEDLPAPGDVTSAVTVPAGVVAHAEVRARQPGVVAGTDALEVTWALVDRAVVVTPLVVDADRVGAGDVLARIEGPAHGVLAGERTALNLLGHLSGIATLTAAFVAQVERAVGPGRCAVRDTRKTLPGLRTLAKHAVVAGGGASHRWSLASSVLVKDNHVAAAGGIVPATRAALAGDLDVQVEVDDLDQLDAVLGLGVSAVLLDNLVGEELREAVRRCRAVDREVFVEASGGVTLATVGALAATGVDAIAVGALTHSAPALDVGLDAVWEGLADVAAGEL